MRKLFVAVCILLIFPVTKAGETFPHAELLISRLYKEFGISSLAAVERKTLGKYFDASLAALLEKERQCVIKTQEICNVDFDLLYASQNPDAADLSIKAAAANKVIVSFRYPSNGERITIQYLLASTRNGPRITDVIYPDAVSLRKLLTTRLP